MKRVKHINMISSACPEQYEGRLETGELFYARCRFGEGELRIGNQEQWDKWDMPTVERFSYSGEHLRGSFKPGDLEKLFTYAGIILDTTIKDDREIYARKGFEAARRIHAENVEAGKTDALIFITTDMDFLNGKLSHEKQHLMMEEMRAMVKGEIKVSK